MYCYHFMNFYLFVHVDWFWFSPSTPTFPTKYKTGWRSCPLVISVNSCLYWCGWWENKGNIIYCYLYVDLYINPYLWLIEWHIFCCRSPMKGCNKVIVSCLVLKDSFFYIPFWREIYLRRSWSFSHLVTLSNSMRTFLDILRSIAWISTESKSSRRELLPSLPSTRLSQGSYYVLMLLHVDLTSLQL